MLRASLLIDLAVFFLFTKPMTTWLARFKFFSTGHKLSGFSAEQALLLAAQTSSPTALTPQARYLAGPNAGRTILASARHAFDDHHIVWSRPL